MDAGTMVLDKTKTLITLIKIREAAEVPALPKNTVLLGKMYDFLPSGIVFSQPSSLTLSYDPNQIPENAISIGLASYSIDSGWTFLKKEAGTVAEVGKISATVGHFTIFGVLAEVQPESGMVIPEKHIWQWWWLIPILLILSGILWFLYKKLKVRSEKE